MRISKTIPSKLEAIPGTISFIVEKLSRIHLNKEVVFNIKLALQEAMVNAVKHGNKMNSGLKVRVNAMFGPKQLTIEVIDQGQGFDYNNIPDPTEAQNLEKLKGRGIFLIRQAIDKVEFQNAGSTIRMIKYLQKGGLK